MSTGLKILLLAATAALVAILITFGFNYYNKGSKMNDQANKKIDNVTTEMSVSDVTKYDGRNDLSGSDVLGAIKHFENDTICINVNNGRGNTTYIYQSDLVTAASGKYSEAMDISKPSTYINPGSTFKGVVDYDGGSKEAGNGSIIGITFTKIK